MQQGGQNRVSSGDKQPGKKQNVRVDEKGKGGRGIRVISVFLHHC